MFWHHRPPQYHTGNSYTDTSPLRMDSIYSYSHATVPCGTSPGSTAAVGSRCPAPARRRFAHRGVLSRPALFPLVGGSRSRRFTIIRRATTAEGLTLIFKTSPRQPYTDPVWNAGTTYYYQVGRRSRPHVFAHATVTSFGTARSHQSSLPSPVTAKWS